MQKSICIQIFFFLFIYSASTNLMFTMNRENITIEYAPLIDEDQTEQWALCYYGKWFDKNNCTQDFKNHQNKICCRTHTTTLALGATCCIISNLALPCNPIPWIYVIQSSCLTDQILGLCNQSSGVRNFDYRFNCYNQSTEKENENEIITLDFKSPLIESIERK